MKFGSDPTISKPTSSGENEIIIIRLEISITISLIMDKVLSRKLAGKLNFHYIDANNIVRKYKISEGYDKKRKTKLVDANKLNKALIREISSIKNANKKTGKKTKKKRNIKNGIIIDSHLSHYLPKKYVDLCIVTKCNLKILQKL